ncbi:MAG: hypothetical protein R3220_02450 [Balneolaceae bacterium]|nr:hypothetical protein [Balneolaceae bacterium]
MSTSELKSELKVLIENESDPQILKAVKALLKMSEPELKLKEKLTSRALKAEKDIKEGKLHDRKEVERRLQTGVDN